MIEDFKNWEWSSYRRILIEKPSKLMKLEVMDWFGNKNYYEEFHAINQKLSIDKKCLLDVY